VEPSPPPAPALAGRLRSPRGQATVDYAALLTLVAVVFIGAGAAAGLSSLPARVAQTLRTGICIVGGDVCRTADATADGLAPCVVAEKAEGAGLTVSVAVLRIGESGEWSAARRSHGTVLITHARDRRAGATGGVGLELGTLGVGVTGSLDVAVSSGLAWELPSIAAAARFVAAVRGGHDPPAPTWRFGDVGDEAIGMLGFRGLGTAVTGVEASWRAAAGVRTGRGETTVFVHAGAELAGPLDLLVGGRPRGTSTAPAGGPTGPLLLSVTRDAYGLRELAVRRVAAGERRGEVVETLGRLDLRNAGNRAAADRLLRVRLPWPPAVASDLRDVLRRMASAGTIERSVYAVQDRSHGFGVAVRLAAELGVEASSVDVTRRLVDASAWTHGSPERRRVDCLGEGDRAAPA
jgi:hypothetical protein